MATKRDDLLSTTYQLLESQGYHATGLNQIIKESGAPKGSLYYYFPDGKEELVAEAIRHCHDHPHKREMFEQMEKLPVHEAVPFLIRHIAGHIADSGWKNAFSIATVAMETATTSRIINEACREVFEIRREQLAMFLERNDFSKKRSGELATFILSGIQGAIILSKTYHSIEPLEMLANEVQKLLQNTNTS